ALIPVVEEPAAVAVHQLAFLRVLIRREAANDAGPARGPEGRRVQLAVRRQRRNQGIAAMIVAVGELGAGVTGKTHDDAAEGHGGYFLLRGVNATGRARVRLSRS